MNRLMTSAATRQVNVSRGLYSVILSVSHRQIANQASVIRVQRSAFSIFISFYFNFGIPSI